MILRLITACWGAIASIFRPITAIERSVPLWPPAQPWETWLYRVLFAPWLRWDTHWYQRIVLQGYATSDGTAQFHPLYPAAAALLARSGLETLISLLLVSTVSAILFLLTFFQLASLDLPTGEAKNAAILLVTFPAACVLFAPYSESLFLWLAALCFLFIRRHRWWSAGIAGGLAALTRQQGIFLLVPLLWEAWETRPRNAGTFRAIWRNLWPAALIPIGLMIWLAYRLIFLNDIRPDEHNLLYSVLISPSAAQVVPIQAFLWPWEALGLALRQLWNMPDVDLAVNLVIAAYFILLLALAWKQIRLSYRWYSLIIFVVSFSYSTGPVHPYMGLPRHLFLAFPLFVGVVQAVRNTWLRLLMAGVGLAGSFFLILLFVLESWVM